MDPCVFLTFGRDSRELTAEEPLARGSGQESMQNVLAVLEAIAYRGRERVVRWEIGLPLRAVNQQLTSL